MTQRKAPRIRQLEALMAVITNGSVTAAAADLGISQPAASRLIADLAKEFDFPLFDKRDGQLVRSQEVRLLVPDIKRVLELMRQISDLSQDITNRKAGRVCSARCSCKPTPSSRRCMGDDGGQPCRAHRLVRDDRNI